MAGRATAAHVNNVFIPLMGRMWPSTPCHHPFIVNPIILKGLNLYVLAGIAAILAQTCILQRICERNAARRMLFLPARRPRPRNANVKP
jgi:hypothetical protein